MESELATHENLFDSPVLSAFAVHKINDHGRSQPRLIALTATSFYNVKKPFIGGYQVRRRIPFDRISGVVRNTERGEFVVKVFSTEPNDYRYQTSEYDSIIKALLSLRPNLKVWTLTVDLKQVARTKYHERNQSLVDVMVREGDERRDLEEIKLVEKPD